MVESLSPKYRIMSRYVSMAMRSARFFLIMSTRVRAFDILGRRTRADPIGVQVGLAAKLVDPLGQKVQMLTLILHVLSELLLDRLTGEASRRNTA